MLPEIVINGGAIVAFAVLYVVLGFAWYAPALFGKVWARGLGKTEEDMKRMMKEGAVKGIIWSLVQGLVMGFVLRHAIAYAAVRTIPLGLFVSFWNWLGFVAMIQLNSVIYEKKPWPYYFANVGYYLVVFLVGGAILTAWV